MKTCIRQLLNYHIPPRRDRGEWAFLYDLSNEELLARVTAAGGIVNSPVYAQLIERGLHRPAAPDPDERPFFSGTQPAPVNPAHYSNEFSWGFDAVAEFFNPWPPPQMVRIESGT